MPKYNVERTRNNIQCRSGFMGKGRGQNMSIRWGESFDYKTQKDAEIAGQTWVKDEIDRQKAAKVLK